MGNPLISVLIPCYNAGRFVGETLESVFGQSWPNLEVVVVNDGSTDDTADVIRLFTRPNLVFLDQNNRGASASRNDAFAASRGDYVQFLDADDLLSQDKLALQMERLKSAPGCIASAEWGRFYSADPSTTRFEAETVWRDMSPLDWLAESDLRMVFPGIWLIPRDVAIATGPWNERLTLSDDMEYFVRVILQAERVLFCPGARAYYRSGVPGSLSGRKNRGAWQSAYNTLILCEHHVREREDSLRFRRLFAAHWQRFAHAVYPYDAFLAEAAIDWAKHLDPTVKVSPEGGPAFQIACWIFGWRRARLLQVASGRQ